MKQKKNETEKNWAKYTAQRVLQLLGNAIIAFILPAKTYTIL